MSDKEEKPQAKAPKGKQKKIAEAKAKKPSKKEPKQKKAIDGIKNLGKCVTCVHFPHKVRGEVQPCPVLKKYVARKAEHPECYKCKIGG